MTKKLTMKQVLQAHNAGAVLTNATTSLELLKMSLDMSDPWAVELVEAVEQFHVGRCRLEAIIEHLNIEHNVE